MLRTVSMRTAWRAAPRMPVRFFADKANKPDAAKEAAAAAAAAAQAAKSEAARKGKHESLLNDDLLAAAGLDVDAKSEAKSGSSSEGSGSGSGASDSTDGSGAKRWENTAKRSREEQSTLQRRARWNNFFYAASLAGLVGGAVYLTRPFDEQETEAFGESNEWTPSAAWRRLKARMGGNLDYFNEPSFEKLLPDPLPAPYGRPMTLVLALDDLLVKSEWTKEHGWRTAKRPGVDYFLGYLAQYYEVVIFSDKYQAFDQDTVLKLDPYRASISYSLFRESTRFKDGKVVKDLNHLNRDLGKVIIVDVSPDAVSMQRDNAILLPAWNGSPKDQDLVRLIPLLEYIGAQPIKDIRPVLKTYEGKNVLDEFERREQVARQNWRAKQQQTGGSWASSLLGMAPKNADMMPQDYVRAEGQKGYRQFQAYLKEHGDKMLEEEKKREQEIMEEHKMTLNKFMTQGAPTPEEIAATMARKEQEALDEAKLRQAAKK